MNLVKNRYNTGEPAYAVDRNGKIVAWNQAAEKALGFAESEALGQLCWELLSGQDIFGNRLCCEGCPIRASAFNNEPINRFQIYFNTASNQRKHFTVSTLMLFNAPGEDVFIHLCTPIPETGNTKTAIENPSKPDYQYKRLTGRETEILTHLHKGKSIKDIADTLTISPLTVRNHVQHILLKLQVHSRYEAVAIGRKLKLI